jgi:GNAT superfamily N-acetyltransferase
MLQIRELRADEIPLLKDFAPPEWKTDLSQLFGRHFGQPYFHPIAAELDGVMVGCANGLLNDNAGWLGNIIVRPEHRGGGIGRALTEALVDFFKVKRVPFQILIATSLGEPLYRKLGFEVVSQYVFFEREGASSSMDNAPGVRALTAEDRESVFALDRVVTGESRRPFLSGFLEGAWVHAGMAGAVDGYFLPSLGNGPVIASNDAAGLALMQYKLSRGASSSVVPEQNEAAADFLRSKAFVETGRAPRMSLGPDVSWQPKRVYCRGSGYCG